MHLDATIEEEHCLRLIINHKFSQPEICKRQLWYWSDQNPSNQVQRSEFACRNPPLTPTAAAHAFKLDHNQQTLQTTAASTGPGPEADSSSNRIDEAPQEQAGRYPGELPPDTEEWLELRRLERMLRAGEIQDATGQHELQLKQMHEPSQRLNYLQSLHDAAIGDLLGHLPMTSQ